jgi:trans-aconitate methyltransferase
MDQQADTNAAIWQSGEIVQTWVAESDQRERSRRPQRELMAALLPFGDQDAFTFLDLGSGTGAASRVLLRLYPRSTAAGFTGIDVYWKHLDYVIYGGCRPI